MPRLVEYGPQGPNRYFGVLTRSREGHEVIAIFGPAWKEAESMINDEVYLFDPPGEQNNGKPSINYKWLVNNLGHGVVMFRQAGEGPVPTETITFRVKKEDGSLSITIFGTGVSDF